MNNMKKIFLLTLFTFFGQQAFSQIYLITISDDHNINNCFSSSNQITLSKITPAGVETHICIDKRLSQGALIALNSEINSIISQGYKLIETSYNDGGLQQNGFLNEGTTFIFAIP